MPQLKELFDVRLTADFVGRNAELDFLLHILDPDGPLVVYLHGIAGAGKSTLLEVFTRRARASGATVIRLDCQAVEPTEAGFLSELTAATGGAPGSSQDVALRLGRVGMRVIVALDTYEVFRLMDAWPRQVFVPLLPDSLDQRSALEFLSRAGVGPKEAKHFEGIYHGHPLALTLAASLQGNDGTSTLNVSVGQGLRNA